MIPNKPIAIVIAVLGGVCILALVAFVVGAIMRSIPIMSWVAVGFVGAFVPMIFTAIGTDKSAFF